MKGIFLIVFLHCTAALEYASKTTFRNAIKGNKITFVNYGAPWCGHCQLLRETWDELVADKENIEDVTLLAINCEELETMCGEMNIETYPALVAYKNGAEIERYPIHAPRSEIALKAALRQYAEDAKPQLVESNGIMFYPEQGVYYMGNELEEDFWVGDVLDVEMECRTRCVFRIPDCYAYSVKVEHPMKGQCYLKTQPDIGNKNEYVKAETESYNSGRISAQEFTHCWSNVYGKNSVHDPYMEDQTKSGCWSKNNLDGETEGENKKTCSITNKDCLGIDCTNTKMKGFIRADAFHDDSLVDGYGIIQRRILFNRGQQPGCQKHVTYDISSNRFNFEFDLASCGMLTKEERVDGQRFIIFSQEISWEDPPANSFGIFLASSYTGVIGLHCWYKADEKTIKNDFKVVTRIFNGNIEQKTNWDYTTDLTFYSDNSFSTDVELTALIIGYPVYFSTSWEVKFIEGFPVEFYADSCSVISKSTENQYAIIKDGCRSKLANTHLYSTSAYQPYQINYSFRSFSFSQGQSAYDLSLVCTIHFCIKGDIQLGKCGFDSNNCPEGYEPLNQATGPQHSDGTVENSQSDGTAQSNNPNDTAQSDGTIQSENTSQADDTEQSNEPTDSVTS